MTTEVGGAPIDAALRSALRPGQNIVIGQGAGAPLAVVGALAKHRDLLQGSRILIGLLPTGLPDLTGAHIRTFFPAGALGSDEALNARGVSYDRLTLFELADGLHTGDIPVDVVLAQGTPQRDGIHSLGVSVDYVAPAAHRAHTVILETGPTVPWTGPRSTVRVDRVLAVAASAGPLAEVRPPSSRDHAMAAHVSRWVPDGATLQLGMGPWATAVAERLTSRRQLRIHTGLLGDWVRALDTAGALNRGVPVVATGAAGSQDFYRYLDSASHIELVGAHETHDPRKLASLPALHTINSVLEVDLQGRANTEIGHGGRRGGIGGLPDFAAAASNADDGLSIVVMSAQAKGVSRIVSCLRPPAVSLERGTVDILVTEHGSADLREVPDDVRAERIIAVSAPEHRAALRDSLHSPEWS